MSLKLLEVDAAELLNVCEAVIKHEHETYTLGSGSEVHVCRFCGKDFDYDFSRDIVVRANHEHTCPVLSAISLMPKKGAR